MLGLVSAMLQVRKRSIMDAEATAKQSTSFEEVRESYQRAVAQSILELGGIRAGCEVSFEQYQTFAEMLVSLLLHYICTPADVL